MGDLLYFKSESRGSSERRDEGAPFVKELEDKNTYDVSIQLSIDGRVSYRGK